MAAEPYNIIVGPMELWTAPVGTAFPVVGASPAGTWSKLATSGDDEYNEDGVSITHEQTENFHRFLGDTGPRKATRSEEGMTIQVTVHDMTLEQYTKAINNVAVIGDAGPPATKAVGLYRGLDVVRFALLCRGPSPYGNWNMDFQVPIVVVTGEPELTFNKEEPTGIVFEFVALVDPAAPSNAFKFGKVIAQSA